MSTYYAIIDTTIHRIIANYFSSNGVDLTKPGQSHDQSHLLHLEVPSDFIHEPFTTVVLNDSGSYQFILDDAAIQQSIKEQWIFIREQRNKKLAESDWRMMVSDTTFTSGQKEQWAIYRQALRDLPNTSTDPNKVVWPNEPTALYRSV